MSDKAQPPPTGRRAVEGILPNWRDRICGLIPGGSFLVDSGNIRTTQNLILRAAKQVGIPVTTRKLENGGLRVWRLE